MPLNPIAPAPLPSVPLALNAMNPASPSPVNPAANASSWSDSFFSMGNNFFGELQKSFPGNYAHLIQWEPIGGPIRNFKQTKHLLGDVASNQPVKDHELITFDDNLKRAASLGIATMATMGLKQGIFGVGEYLGFLSWFGAMAATPAMINKMVHLKTGVNLNQNYDSSYGQRLNLYKDPNYLPLHILTDQQIERAADKLGIPTGPNRRRETEEKMRQVSVQAHTWWMLAAGPATPVISGLTCDLLQNPVMCGVNAVKRQFALMETQRVFARETTPESALAHKAEVYLNQVIGAVPESKLSGWWHQFGRDLVKQAGFMNAMSLKEIRNANRDVQRDKLVDHLIMLGEKDRPRIDKTLAFLDDQLSRETVNGEEQISGKLANIWKETDDYLERFKDGLSDEHLASLEMTRNTRLANAESTIIHYRKLFKALTAPNALTNKNELKKSLKSLMKSPTINGVQETLGAGHWKAPKELVGNRETFYGIVHSVQNDQRQFGRAFDMMGAAPEEHLLGNALKSEMLGKMWRTRVGLYVGGGLLAATALYNYFLVGRNFKPVVKKPAGVPNA